MHFFQCSVRADRHGDLISPMILGNRTQAVGDIIERHVPFDFLPLPSLLQHRLEQTFATVKRFVGEALLVRDPALVDIFIVERKHALDHIPLDLHRQVSTRRVVRRH